MKPSLLDVSVLLALLHEPHEAHALVYRWFRETGRKSWASCALTQSGFVRIATNPAFSERAVSVAEAIEMLARLTQLPGHQFWPMELSLPTALEPFRERVFDRRQITGGYLLGLAIKNKARLVTLDNGIEALAQDEFAPYVRVLQ